ncbi:cyclic AMP-responsive element-binding protein 3-like protein 3-A isoform X2 [Eucyclogobius newberryi]|uniref:cyclic AMP-responsive element-binding protein 3-like protein 3-A isoform X2 n=1 Tax=Eucyclogobius newberryi TaxID=166745 RepID=UPI003B5C2AB1
MTLTTEEVQVGMDVIDLLLRNADEQTNSYHSNRMWALNIPDSPSPGESSADDFLESLLGGSDCSSAPASPLWSPCASYSEDHALRPTESQTSLRPVSECAAPWPSQMQIYPSPSKVKMERTSSDVAVDLGCDCTDLEEKYGLAYYLKANHPNLRPSSQPLTVKDLLLSNLGPTGQRVSHQSLPELVLDEDEKRLLAKEGVTLSSKLPLTKFEERVLKKIRRKIRNKRSAQESRKKKREYIDCLEGRMSASNAHNLKLQQRIQQLEETNKALLDQLSQLQAILATNSKKATHKGTCILVLLLSFSFIISSNLQPEPSNQVSPSDFTETRVLSRSLQSIQAQDTSAWPPLSALKGLEMVHSGMERIWSWAQSPTAAHRHQDYA